MPTYQYACTACGHRFEAVQSFSDASLTDCPECAGRLRKVFSSVGIVFKGSGFYRTDSRAKNGAAGDGAKDSPTTEKPPSESSSSGTDPSPAKKDVAKPSDTGAKTSSTSSSSKSTAAAAS